MRKNNQKVKFFMYVFIHILSYLVRNYILGFPEIYIFNIPPLITEVFILNGLLGLIAYKLTGLHYTGGFPALGSTIYLIEYFIALGLIWISIFIFRLLGIPDLMSIFVSIVLMIMGNFKLSNIT